MKPRSIVIAVVAVLALAVWILWLFGHSKWNGPTAAALISTTPAETPEIAQPRPAPPPANPAAIGSAAPHLAGALSASPLRPGAPATSSAPASSAAIQNGNAPHKLDRATAMIELQKVRVMIASYHTLMGQNPVGTNAEIMKALMGANPRQAVLGPPPGQTLNDKGELLDPWGTPYFFHQLSGDDMEIHSAGPDKIMGTGDDLVVH